MAQTIRAVFTKESQAFPYLLGAAAEGEYTCFTVAAAKEDKAALLLYDRGDTKAAVRLEFPAEGWGNLRRLTVEGIDRRRMEYCLEIRGQEEADPCSRVLYGRPEFGQGRPARPKELYHGQKRQSEPVQHSQLRSGFLTDGYDWEEDGPLGTPWHQSFLYQLHVRGFTKDKSSGVRSPGTYAGVTEKLPYLRRLGVTAVELLPAYDFDENGTAGPVNYWGYTSGYFFAPKSAYCDGSCGVPCDVQFKDMVKALHRAGIEVLMQFCFPEGTVPETVSQVLRFWAMEYHVDGFRVMGSFLGQAVWQDPVLAGLKLLSFGWDGGARTVMTAVLDSGFTESMRRLLRGDEDQLQALIHHIKNNPPDCPPVHYIAETNGFTLKDLVSYETKHNEANGENNRDGSWYNYSDNCGEEGPSEDQEIRLLRLKQRRNALLLVFLSQGVPLLQAGDEMGHTKDGNNNSWCQDNAISWLNWEREEEEDRLLYEFTCRLSAFRREHGVFHQRTEPQCCDYRSLGMPDLSFHGVHPWLPQYENFRRQLGVLYNGAYGTRNGTGPDDSFYVMFNFHSAAHEFDLPKTPGGGRWQVLLDTSAEVSWTGDQSGAVVDGGLLSVEPRSVVILIEKERKSERRKTRKKPES